MSPKDLVSAFPVQLFVVLALYVDCNDDADLADVRQVVGH